MRLLKLFLAGIALLMVSCNSTTNLGPYISITGFTQGTTFSMIYQSPTTDTLDLSGDVEQLLANFDMSLSTYIDSSNISRINRNETDLVDEYFQVVFDESKRINEISGGVFDITVGPLIDAWGFGRGGKLDMNQQVIDSILQYVGMDKVEIVDGKVKKDIPGIRFDVNAIAQGYSVDLVSEYFESRKIQNYMVEIGGELRTHGLSSRGDKWKIGVDKPFYGNQAVGSSLQAVIDMTDKSLASSGNYRKFLDVDGKKIVHTVDPLTGYTKPSNLLSVTIITDECITADGLATACMALGLEKAKEFILQQEGVDALFIFSDDDGLFFEWMTDGMKKMIEDRK